MRRAPVDGHATDFEGENEMRSRWARVGRAGVVFMIAATILAGSYAFTAANTVPASNAGDGSGAVSGYTVTNVHYTLDTDPSKIAAVSFTLNTAVPTGGTLKITLDGGTNWFSCTVNTTTPSCTTTGAGQPTVLAAANLRVVAAQ
jgi:hypothetical protein